MGKIILAGYMGSGKSTVGHLLEALWGLKCIDLDNYIEEKTNLAITEIFAEKGELYFRKIEHESLKELLDSKEDFVLSLGGGTPCYANNMELILNSGAASIYLKATIGTLYDRLTKSVNPRPLIIGDNSEEIREFIAKHLFERSYYYSQSNFKIDTDNKSPEQVAIEIVALLA